MDSQHRAHMHKVDKPCRALRVFPPGVYYPEPGFIHGVMVIEHEPGVGELSLLDKVPTILEYRAALECMARHGFTHHITERHEPSGELRRIIRRIRG